MAAFTIQDIFGHVYLIFKLYDGKHLARPRAMMASIDGAVIDFKRLDLLATGDSTIHRLDARVKVLVTLAYIIAIVSFGKYELAAMLPFVNYPIAMAVSGNLPAGYIARKAAVVIPFALVVGMFNPLFDREIVTRLGPLAISGGWLSCLTIVVRAVLTVGAAAILVAVTGFPAICRALEQLGMPQAFAVQLLFLYRYIFVLTEEGLRASRARELRSFGNKSLSMRSYSSLVSHLLLRTWQRAERIHMAMLARGFDGQFRTRQPSHFGQPEAVFILGWFSLFILLRLYNLPHLIGALITGMLP
jgi:cobalt/nickel transport system permease protein